MHEVLRLLHPLTALVRLLIDSLYRLGPGMLAKHTMACAWAICLLCLCAGGFDLAQRRRLDAVLWAAIAGLLFTGFRYEATTSGFRLAPDFAIAAAVVGLWLLVRALLQWFRGSGRPDTDL